MTAPTPPPRLPRSTLGRRHGDAGCRGRRLLAVAAAGVVVLGGCTSGRDDPPWSGPLPAADEISALRGADDCAALTAAARPSLLHAVDAMWPEPDRGPFGLFGGGDEDSSSGRRRAGGGRRDDGKRRRGDVAAGSGRDADSSRVIGTNTQERDVAESDIVATDGTRIVSVVGATLRVTQLDGAPAVDGRLDLSTEGATELFLRGDTALVLGTTTSAPVPANDPGPVGPVTTLTSVSLADPSAPSVISTARLEGTLVTAREIDGRARVVVQQTPSRARPAVLRRAHATTPSPSSMGWTPRIWCPGWSRTATPARSAGAMTCSLPRARPLVRCPAIGPTPTAAPRSMPSGPPSRPRGSAPSPCSAWARTSTSCTPSASRAPPRPCTPRPMRCSSPRRGGTRPAAAPTCTVSRSTGTAPRPTRVPAGRRGTC